MQGIKYYTISLNSFRYKLGGKNILWIGAGMFVAACLLFFIVRTVYSFYNLKTTGNAEEAALLKNAIYVLSGGTLVYLAGLGVIVSLLVRNKTFKDKAEERLIEAKIFRKMPSTQSRSSLLP